jgi:crotonobetainyl-CoA:carnitine CoA-transferase CaiB-like acyl-CoA transferase
MELPLDGVRVIDLTFNISGPYATMILGDLGADVIKLERPDGGDDARRMAPSHGSGSAYFFAINRNKRSATLDLRDEDERARLRRLLEGADVLVTNARAHKLAAWGLDFDALRDRFPRLIYADISGYGADGPESERPGYDMVLQARSGLMSVTGEPGRPPVRVGVSILDMGTGLWLALGVMAALRRRDRTGAGSRVSTSLLEVGAAYMAYDLAAFELTGSVPGPRGSGHPAFAPYGVFRAADGYVAIGVGSDRLFARLAEAVGAPGWVGDPRFATNDDRVANRDVLASELEGWLATASAAEWVERLGEAGIPADEAADAPRLLEDPQLAAVRAWLDVAVDEETTLRQPGLPIRFDGERPPSRRPPPRAGEHTEDVHREEADR